MVYPHCITSQANPALALTPPGNARRIVNTRNKIIHGYDEVDEVMLWEIIVKHLPILNEEVQLLLS